MRECSLCIHLFAGIAFADAVTVERIAEARREDLATKRRSNRQRRKQHTGDSELVHSATSEANRNDDTVVQGKEACSNQSRKEDNVPLLHGQDSHNDDGANEEHDVRDRPRLITKQDVVAKTGDYQQQQRLQIGYSRYQQQLAVLSNMEEDYVRQIEHVFERQQAQGLCLDVEKALKMRKEAVQSAFDEVVSLE